MSLKGGASLRFFFESLRYSEDIDLDAVDIDPWKLEEKVNDVLASTATGLLLRGGGSLVARPRLQTTVSRGLANALAGAARSGERSDRSQTDIER